MFENQTKTYLAEIGTNLLDISMVSKGCNYNILCIDK